MKEKKIDIVDIIIAVQNHTFLRMAGVEDHILKKEIHERLHELTGILELAKLIELDEKIIESLEMQRDWLIKRRNAPH